MDAMTGEASIRLAVFAAALVLLMVLEAMSPRRPRMHTRRARWPSNLGVVALNTAVARLLLPLGAVGAAELAGERGWGLFNAVGIPDWLAFAASFVLLDLAIWGQHVLFHRVPLLWRFHRMHHADTDFDATTGLRFHPGEILLSLLIKMALVAALGAPAAAVIAFEVVLNATSMWNHANLRLPLAADRVLRAVLVTPDMHRVHHSWRREETDSNYGFNFACWDRLFGTYRAQPVDGHDAMTIGLPYLRDPAELRIGKLLSQPFRQPSIDHCKLRAERL
jgi:sterol desaturase/sphingolipid hydroxylase (fatty acid hydroxylase superfamily)